MARLLNKTDISDLCLGTTVLGTGGGGSPELGFLILSRLLEMGTEIRLISVKEVPDDEIVVHPAMIGSIAPSKIELSRPVSSDTSGRCLFSPFTAWFPGGATLSQPCIRWPRPLSEPDLRISRIRLFKQVHIPAP